MLSRPQETNNISAFNENRTTTVGKDVAYLVHHSFHSWCMQAYCPPVFASEANRITETDRQSAMQAQLCRPFKNGTNSSTYVFILTMVYHWYATT